MNKLAKFFAPLAVVCAASFSQAPAHAQFGGFGGGGGSGDMMTTMAPMLEMMKAKMGEKRFGQLMQTMGPMAEKMMGDGGGFGGMGGGFGGMGGGFGGMGGMGAGGFDMASMSQFISPAMISSMVSMGKGSRKGSRKHVARVADALPALPSCLSSAAHHAPLSGA